MKFLLLLLTFAISIPSFAAIEYDLGEMDIFDKQPIELPDLNLRVHGFGTSITKYKVVLNIKNQDLKRAKVDFTFLGTHVSCAMWSVNAGNQLYCIRRTYSDSTFKKRIRIKMSSFETRPEQIELTISSSKNVLMGKPMSFTIKPL